MVLFSVFSFQLSSSLTLTLHCDFSSSSSAAAAAPGGQRIYGHCHTVLVPLPKDEQDSLRAMTSPTTAAATTTTTTTTSFPKVLYEPICFCMITRLPFHQTFVNALSAHVSASLPAPSDSISLLPWCEDVCINFFTVVNTNTPTPTNLAMPMEPKTQSIVASFAPT